MNGKNPAPYWKFLRSYRGLGSTIKRSSRILRRYGWSPQTLAHRIRSFMQDMRERGYPLTLPVTGQLVAKYPALFRQLNQMEVEFAIHGYFHQDYTQLHGDRVREALEQATRAFVQAGIDFCGFRFPYLRWNDRLLTRLNDFPFLYDSSEAFYLPPRGALRLNGHPALKKMIQQYQPASASRRQILPGWRGKLVELPVCLPDDDLLLDRVELPSDRQIGKIWLQMLHRIRQQGELFVLQLHPERYFLLKNALTELLDEAIHLGDVWVASLQELARWWQQRRAIRFSLQVQDNQMQLQLTYPSRLQLDWLPAKPESEGEHRYLDRGDKAQLIYRGKVAPVIGLAAAVPTGFQHWLENNGFLCSRELSPRQAAVFYHQAPSGENQREWLQNLLHELRHPLLQIKCWPAGYRCALAVTGDIDALTVQDFFSRAYGN